MLKFYKNGEWETNPDYKEILKLDKMLTETNIPHTLERLYDGWQVTYPDKGNKQIADAIEHYGSYGESKDLLEIMGLTTDEEDSVAGYLTAQEVFDRIEKHYHEVIQHGGII